MHTKIPSQEPKDPLLEETEEQDLPAEEQISSVETAIVSPSTTRAEEAAARLPSGPWRAPGDPMNVLVPVIPDDSFYDAVVAAGSVVAQQGGSITFLFLHTQPPDDLLEDQEGGPTHWDEKVLEEASAGEIESWQEQQIAALTEARELLEERGVSEDAILYRFVEEEVSADISISEEIARGAYDMIVLPEGAPLELSSATVGATTDDLIELLRGEYPEVGILTTGPVEDPYRRQISEAPQAFGEREERAYSNWAEAGEPTGYIEPLPFDTSTEPEEIS